MKQFLALSQLLGGHALPPEDDGPARRIQVALLAVLSASLLSAAFGFALGGATLEYGVPNLIKMPLVVVLSSLASLPAGWLMWKLSGAHGRSTDLIIGAASGLLSGTTVLAVLAPLVGLYYYTSENLGPAIGLGVAGLAYVVGTWVSWRAVMVRTEGPTTRSAVPLAVMTAVHAATLLQLISVSSLMQESTFLDDGLEGLSSSAVRPS